MAYFIRTRATTTVVLGIPELQILTEDALDIFSGILGGIAQKWVKRWEGGKVKHQSTREAEIVRHHQPITFYARNIRLLEAPVASGIRLSVASVGPGKSVRGTYGQMSRSYGIAKV